MIMLNRKNGWASCIKHCGPYNDSINRIKYHIACSAFVLKWYSNVSIKCDFKKNSSDRFYTTNIMTYHKAQLNNKKINQKYWKKKWFLIFSSYLQVSFIFDVEFFIVKKCLRLLGLYLIYVCPVFSFCLSLYFCFMSYLKEEKRREITKSDIYSKRCEEIK